jgi:hypothetical protein
MRVAGETLTPWSEVYGACDDGDDRSTAEAIMKKLGLNKHQRDVLAPAIKLQVGFTRRRANSQARQLIFSQGRSAVKQSGTGLLRPLRPAIGMSGPDLRKLLALDPFDLDQTGRNKVAWERATINDHKARVGFLSRMIAGTQATIDDHKYVITILEKAHVNTLGEYLAKDVAA